MVATVLRQKEYRFTILVQKVSKTRVAVGAGAAVAGSACVSLLERFWGVLPEEHFGQEALEGYFEDFKDVDPHHHKVKNKWKKTHTNMISAIKEAKKNRPPTAMANIDVKIVT